MKQVHLDQFADQELVDPDGASHRLGDRWENQPAVVLFLRHFG